MKRRGSTVVVGAEGDGDGLVFGGRGDDDWLHICLCWVFCLKYEKVFEALKSSCGMKKKRGSQGTFYTSLEDVEWVLTIHWSSNNTKSCTV